MKKQKEKSKKTEAAKKKDGLEEATEGIAGPSVVAEAIDRSSEQAKSRGNAGAEEQNPPPSYFESKDEAVDEKPLESVPETPKKAAHTRQPSLSLQSKMRSSSFRRTSMSQVPLSPGINGTQSPDLPPLTPESDSVNSIYRKQAARLDELEKENRRLAKDAQDVEKKWRQTEEELEELRETSGEVAELKSRAQRAESQVEENNKLVRRNIIDECPVNVFLTSHAAESRKRILPTTNFPTAIAIIQTPCLFAQPSDKYLL